MRRFTVKVLLAMLPVALMAAVNYTRDPAGLFGGGVEARIGELLVEGHAVRAPDEYNARLVHRYYVQHAPAAPDVAVLGTSRAMRIRASAFPGRTVMNQAVFAGALEDFVGILGMYDRAGRWPREVVLTLDPWLLNDFSGLTGWRSIASEYEYMSRRLGIEESRLLPTMWPELDEYFALVSPAYFQAALRSRKGEGARRVEAVPDEPAEGAVIRRDGSRLDGRVARDRTRADVERAAQRDASPPIDRLEHFSAISRERERSLLLMTRFLVARGVRVTFVLLPFHPRFHDVLFTREAYAMVPRTEQRFRDLARESGVSIRGSYDAAACGCGELDFLDGLHPDASCSERALTASPF
jgi:hypothetical protein